MTTPLTTPLSLGRQKAGRLGGATTLKRHGRDHFAKIGRKGGKARKRSPQAS